MSMSSLPVVSIIIASYNYGFVIANTLDCLLNQTLVDWEAIIVDDGSVDDTEAIVSAYVQRDPRIIYIQQINAGVSAARNAGMRIAKGQFIQFLDADDLLSKQKLRIHVQYLLKNPEKHIVYSGVRYFDHSNPDVLFFSIDGQIKEPIEYDTLSSDQAIKKMFNHNIVVINAPLFRREVMQTIGLFDETMTSLEDWDYWARMAFYGYTFHYLISDDALALVRVHKTSLSWNWNRMTANRVALYDNMNKYILENILDKSKQKMYLEANKDSEIFYLGFAVFMNIKHYDLWWGLKKGIYWSYKFKKYKYFFSNVLYSLKVRFKTT